MKRVASLFLAVLAICLSFSGCSSSLSEKSSVSLYEDGDGNSVMEYEGTVSVSGDTLPVSGFINGSEIKLVDVQLYEDKASDGFDFYAVATIDVSDLAEEDVYWLLEDDMDISFYATSEKNRLDFHGLTRIGVLQTVLDDGKPIKLSFIFTDLGDVFPFSMAGAEVDVVLYLWQQETYEHVNSDGESEERDKLCRLSYTATVEDSIQGSGKMDPDIYNLVCEYLENQIDFLRDVLD